MLCVTISTEYEPRSSWIRSSILPVAIGSRAEQGSSISSTSGSAAIARAMHKPLLLAARQAQAALVQPVFDFVPQSGAAKAAFADFVQHAAIALAVDPQGVNDVLVNAHRKRIRLLKHHAHPLAKLDHIDGRVIDRIAVEPHIALDAHAAQQIVQPIDAA